MIAVGMLGMQHVIIRPFFDIINQHVLGWTLQAPPHKQHKFSERKYKCIKLHQHPRQVDYSKTYCSGRLVQGIQIHDGAYGHFQHDTDPVVVVDTDDKNDPILVLAASATASGSRQQCRCKYFLEIVSICSRLQLAAMQTCLLLHAEIAFLFTKSKSTCSNTVYCCEQQVNIQLAH